ncbi:V-type ATP synthase subunit E [Herbivorax sp. ANBcel31]|uniref:V-type ATP synthase subunit E n=1 Tax=Herbivorax sp. ANBcel31 TaxID=3069754 RepID=UPI0027B4A032|nr:V-type ATP synthase subunit E [Herbivorax sp. ANBcel31]MDQ2087262.1 V-type ATP synthase subunit E [Herbivorax sp. ANBcel31]
MATINEKLDKFSKIALEEATKKRDEILQQMKKEKDALMHQKKEEFQLQAQEFLKKELQFLEKEKNDIISKSFSQARELLSETRERIKKEVFNEINEKINEFINSTDYEKYLLNLINNSCNLAGKGELVVLLRKKDIDLILKKERNLSSKASFEEAEDEIIGGCKIFNKTMNTFIDSTISKKLEEAKDSFFETSCLKID